tara:strand:- start:18 stop:518 length:501 start_codon:yes stop_codon:yes gene_type:complete
VDKNNIGFRSWYYFRMGWSVYFAFILAAINTLTVTYFLAVDNYPELKTIFPSFEVYIVTIVSIGIPLLVLIGYSHYKRTVAFKSEVDVQMESNPYQRRNIVNNSLVIESIIITNQLLLKLYEKKNLKDDEFDSLKLKLDEISKLVKSRTFENSVDLDFIQDNIRQS